MAGLGKTTFVAGTILTASQVNGYLMDQAVQVYAGTAARGSAIGGSTTEGMMTYLADTNSVRMATGTATFVNVDSLPIVAGTASRDALYPVPTMGNTVFRTDTGVAESYYAAYSTAVPGGRDAAGWYSTTKVDGLVPVVPTLVTPVGAGSSASHNAFNGKITFATCTAITVNGVFTSAYENYHIVMSSQKSAVNSNAHVAFRVSSAGTAVSTSTYNGGAVAYTIDTGVYQNLLNQSATSIGYVMRLIGNARYSSSSLDIFSPAVATPTRLSGTGIGSVTDTVEQALTMAGIQTNATAYDGFSLVLNANTFSGTIQIYGYN
jgi:hypothetical protein